MSTKKNHYQIIGISIFMLFISIASTWAFGRGGKLIYQFDGGFHLARINELSYAVVHHNNWFNLYSFNSGFIGNVGSAVQNFYPNLMMWPWVLVFLITHNYVTSFYYGATFYLFISLMISFLCYKHLTKNTSNSVLFSVLYNGGMGGILYLIGFGQFGDFLGSICYPPVFLALYMIFIKHHYQYFYLLAISMIFICFSHLMTLYFIGIMIIIIYLVSLITQRENWFLNLMALVKAGIITLLITGWWFIYLLQNLHYVEAVSNGNVTDAIGSIGLLFSKTTHYVVAGMAGYDHPLWFILSISFLFCFRKASRLYRYSYLLMIFFFWTITNSFPWPLIQHIPAFQTIQYVYRLTIPMTFFGAIAGTFLFNIFIQKIYDIFKKIFKTSNSSNSNYSYFQSFCYTILIGLILLTNVYLVHNSLPLLQPHNNKYCVTNIKKNVSGISNMDYYPKELHGSTWMKKMTPEMESIIAHALFDASSGRISTSVHMYKIRQSYNKAHFTITNKGRSQLTDLPILNFNNQYQLLINGKTRNYLKSPRGTMVFNVPSGTSKITLITKPIVSQIVLMIVAIISAGYLIYYKLLSKFKYRVNKISIE